MPQRRGDPAPRPTLSISAPWPESRWRHLDIGVPPAQVPPADQGMPVGTVNAALLPRYPGSGAGAEPAQVIAHWALGLALSLNRANLQRVPSATYYNAESQELTVGSVAGMNLERASVRGAGPRARNVRGPSTRKWRTQRTRQDPGPAIIQVWSRASRAS